MPKLIAEMSAFISWKKSLLILLCGFCTCAGVVFVQNFFLAGPKLGTVYDFFLKYRPPHPVSNEILLIKTGEFAESADIFSILLTLTEMEASELILETMVSHSSPTVAGTEADIRRIFNDEYGLLAENIRNLFEAIRSGSIPPSLAPGYVGQLVELTEQGRERLISALIDTDEDVIRSAAAFGSFWQAEDFGGGRDRDGKLRRVRPVETESSSEHLIYSRLKTRYAGTMLESTEQGQFLTLRGYDEKEIKIPLDRDGNIITAEADNAFRSIEFYIFREYEEADRAMHQVLKEAELIGAFSRTLPERSPLALCDYAFALREEMLKAPDPENRSAWIASRENYIESLNDFLFGPAETLLINGYEEVIADENSLKEDGKAKLRTLRDEMIRLFAAMREKYINLAELRAVLKTELAASFCIMGNDDNTEYSALLADALVSGSHIKPAADLYAFLFPACAACIIILIIFWLPPLPLLFSGLGASVLAAAVFGWSFVYTAYWLDPVTAFGSIFAGTFVVFCCKNSIIRTGTRRFRIAYGAAVSGNVLGQLIRAGRPDVSKIVVSEAVVIVIKNITLFTREYRKGAEQAVKSKKQFHIAVKKILFNTGAVIAGYEGDTVLACFGSPLDKTEDPVRKAGALLKELQRAGQDGWRFGMDAGVCAFSWSAETGFFVNGSPAVRARALASKTIHLKVRALITGPVKDKLNPRAEKIGTLYDGNDPFYEFPA